jgi:hypothetical protein
MENILIVTEYGIEARREELRATRRRLSYGNPGGILALVSSVAGTLRKASAMVRGGLAGPVPSPRKSPRNALPGRSASR